MAKKKKFGGELDEPLPPLRVGLLMDDEATRKVFTSRIALENRKLELLLAHYGLETGDYLNLSLALAREIADGFKETKPKGRRKKWTDLVLSYLFVEIKRKCIERGVRGNKIPPEIFAAVAKQAPWDSFLEKCDAPGIDPDPAEAIRKAYFKAKKEAYSGIFWKAYCWHKETDTVDEWEKEVLSGVQKSAGNEII